MEDIFGGYMWTNLRILVGPAFASYWLGNSTGGPMAWHWGVVCGQVFDFWDFQSILNLLCVGFLCLCLS
jgi:hypothetical protein